MRRDREGAHSVVAHALLRAVSTLVSTSYGPNGLHSVNPPGSKEAVIVPDRSTKDPI
jgi:hypothetical protein